MTKYFNLYRFKVKRDLMIEVHSLGTLWKYSEETMTTGGKLKDQGLIHSRSSRFFSSQCPDWFWNASAPYLRGFMVRFLGKEHFGYKAEP
jgi:hypothetical protein